MNDDIKKLIANPNNTQHYIYKSLKENNETEIVTATTPMSMLLETCLTSASSSILETNSVMRKHYPNLAINKEELYNKITPDLISSLFATPAETDIIFYINVLDLKQKGYRKHNSNYVETIVPKYTKVNVMNTTLTLLNDISIKLYDSGNVFVEQQPGDMDIAFTDSSILRSAILPDNNNNHWIVVETRLKQVSVKKREIPINPAKGFEESLSLDNDIYFTKASYNVNGTDINIPIVLTEDYIDTTSPKMIVKLLEDKVTFKLPDIYLVNNEISGTITIQTFETKGNIYLPLKNIAPMEYEIVLGDTTSSLSASTSTELNLNARSLHILDGGTNGLTTAELKERIINNTLGDIDLPITNHQIKRKADMMGYELATSMDVITKRHFVAMKSLSDINSSLINANIDVFFNRAMFTLDELKDNDFVSIREEDFVIRSNSVFIDDNGLRLMTNQEMTELNSMSLHTKINYLKNNKLYYNPYYYVIEIEDGHTESTVYDLDVPEINQLKILKKNNNIPLRINIDKIGIEKHSNGYKIFIVSVGSEKLSSDIMNNIIMQLSLPIKDADGYYINIIGKYDAGLNMTVFNLDTDMLVQDESFVLSNGHSMLTDKVLSLISTAKLYTLTTDAKLLNTTDDFLYDKIDLDNPDLTTTEFNVLTYEEFEITLGYKLDYIYKTVYNTYTSRKFKTYKNDKPMFYKEDVYEYFEETNSTYKIEYENGVKKVYRNKLYSKGDPVLDSNGNQSYEYREGDYVLDDNGSVIIDTHIGIVRNVLMLMLEYEFKLSSSLPYKNYLNDTIDRISHSITNDMITLNNDLLEETSIFYMSYRDTNNVPVLINNVTYVLPNIIEPEVTLYVIDNKVLSVEEVAELRRQVSFIIAKHLDKSIISIRDMKDEFIALSDDILAAKVSNIETIEEGEMIKIKNKKKLTLGKELVINKADTIVNYKLKSFNINYT